MKKTILVFISTLALICSLEANAASPLTEEARRYRAELVKKQDELLELLLQVPFEQRQYVFPLLSANQSIPKKIKTHPEVLVWKGKRPTRIADRFKDDEELIQYLPEQFYYFLAPEMWGPKEQNTIMEGNPNQILRNMIESQNKTADSIAALPEELTVLNSGMEILQKWVQQTGKQPVFPLFFEKWVKSAPQEIQKQIQEKTGETSSNFGKKIDLISQAYRLYTIQKIPPASNEQKLVQEYWSLIPFIFKKNGFTDALNTTLYKD